MTTPTPKDAVPFDPPVFCSGIERDCKHGQLARSCHICELERELAAVREELAQERERAERAEQKLADERAMHGLTLSRAERAEALAEAAEKDAGRWRACLDSVGVAVSIFNVDPAGWRYPEGDHLVAAIDNIIEGNEGAWKVPIDTGGPPLRAERTAAEAQAEKNAKDAERYRWLRDESWKGINGTFAARWCLVANRGAGLDAAIDAIAEGKK